MSYESLIFDIDGTIWDSRSLVAKGYNAQLHDEGLDHLFVDAEELKRQFGKVMTAIADNIFSEISAPERYALMERCMAREHVVLEEDPCDIAYPKVKETLAELAKKYRLFIVSNSQSGYPQLCIQKLGLEAYIEGHLCFGDTGTTKGKTIRTLMEMYNIQSCAYVGDIQGDYEATVEADVPFIWASYGFGVCETYAAKINAFEDLLNL